MPVHDAVARFPVELRLHVTPHVNMKDGPDGEKNPAIRDKPYLRLAQSWAGRSARHRA